MSLKHAMFILILLTGGLAGVLQTPAQAQTTSTKPFTVIDTGQEKCYNDVGSEMTCPAAGESFYGQDAHHNGNQPSYTLSADGLSVYDNVTGLTWTQSPDLNGDGVIDVNDKLSFDEAQAHPDTLNASNYGGYSDWRLPTIKEIYSLMDFRGIDPSGPSSSGERPLH